MDDSSLPDMCQLSAGIHIVLPSYYSPLSMGLLDPATADGRVIFFLPWEGEGGRGGGGQLWNVLVVHVEYKGME